MAKEPYLAHSELTHEIYIVSGRNKYLVTDQAVKAVKAIQTLEQEPKQADIEQKAQEYEKAFMDGFESCSDLFTRNKEQQPCDDAISRDAVIDALSEYVSLEEYEDKSHTFTVKPLIKRIVKLPSVTQKSGKWLRSLIYENIFNCSKCGSAGYDTFNYCPNCGARMAERR